MQKYHKVKKNKTFFFFFLFFIYSIRVVGVDNNKEKWEIIFSNKNQEQITEHIVLLIVDILNQASPNIMQLVNGIIQIYGVKRVLYLSNVVEQILLISNNKEITASMEQQIDSLQPILEKSTELKSYSPFFLNSILKNLLVLQSFYISNAMGEAVYSTNHPVMIQGKKNSFFHKRQLFYLFYFKNLKKIPNIFKKKKGSSLFINQKIPLNQLNFLISLCKKRSQFFIRSNNYLAMENQLQNEEFFLKKERVEGKDYYLLVLCDREIEEKIENQHIRFIIMDVECSKDINLDMVYNLFHPINLEKSSTIISNIEKVINTNKNLKVTNYSKVQTTDLLNIGEPIILNLAANFPQNKFVIINEKMKDGKKVYSLFIILDLMKMENPSGISIKDQSKINRFIINNLAQYCGNIS